MTVKAEARADVRASSVFLALLNLSAFQDAFERSDGNIFPWMTRYGNYHFMAGMFELAMAPSNVPQMPSLRF